MHLEGWGAYSLDEEVNGEWPHQEKWEHINFLELRAIRFGLQSFEGSLRGKTVAILRQHHCTFIPQQGRWHEIEFTQQGSSDNLTVDGGECSNHCILSVCERQEQCGGKLSKSEGTGNLYGMDTSPICLQWHVEGVGLSISRSVHHKDYRLPNFVSIPRSCGHSHGCLSLPVGFHGDVCLSTLSDYQEGTQQTLQLKRG